MRDARQQDRESRVLVQLTDLHVQVGPGDAAASERVERAVRLVQQLDPAPEAVLLSGDLVNSAAPQEYERLGELLAPLRAMRVLPLVGNHDDRQLLRDSFAHVPEIAALGDARHVQYDVRTPSFRVLVLDSQHGGHDDGKLCGTRQAWLAERLAADRETPTIVAIHHPPFDIGVPALDDLGIRRDHRQEFASLLSTAPNVERVVSGHVHRPVTGAVARIPVFGCPSVFYPALVALRRDGPIQLVDGPVGLGVHVRTASGDLASHVRMVGAVPGVVTPIPPLEPPNG